MAERYSKLQEALGELPVGINGAITLIRAAPQMAKALALIAETSEGANLPEPVRTEFRVAIDLLGGGDGLIHDDSSGWDERRGDARQVRKWAAQLLDVYRTEGNGG